MIIEFECLLCNKPFACDVGSVTIDEQEMLPSFSNKIYCPFCCNEKGLDDLNLTELGQSQLTRAMNENSSSPSFAHHDHETDLPDGFDNWLTDIGDAYADAAESEEEDLFHLGPPVCLKRRGLTLTEEQREEVTEVAIGSYLATKEKHPGVMDNPLAAFTFSYLASHFALDLMTKEQVDIIMTVAEENLSQIQKYVDHLGH